MFRHQRGRYNPIGARLHCPSHRRSVCAPLEREGWIFKIEPRACHRAMHPSRFNHAQFVASLSLYFYLSVSIYLSRSVCCFWTRAKLTRASPQIQLLQLKPTPTPPRPRKCRHSAFSNPRCMSEVMNFNSFTPPRLSARRERKRETLSARQKYRRRVFRWTNCRWIQLKEKKCPRLLVHPALR